MPRWISILLLAGMLVSLPAMTYAQDTPQFLNLEIELWPEYDQPTMLVIYHISLAPEVILPTQLAVRIPASVGQPHAVAVRQPDGSLISINYEITSDGTWSTIQVVANLPEIQIEYYDPNLTKDGNQRAFTYDWPGDYGVTDSLVSVLEPVDASEMTISPGPVTMNTTPEGLTYFHKDVGPLAAGQSFQIDLTYNKETDTLSVASLPVQSSEPLTGSTGWQETMVEALPWLLGVGGLLLIAGGVLWYWQSGRQTQPARTRGRRSSRRSSATSQPTDTGAAIYCHHCGKRAASGDRFCRSCGTRLRVE